MFWPKGNFLGDIAEIFFFEHEFNWRHGCECWFCMRGNDGNSMFELLRLLQDFWNFHRDKERYCRCTACVVPLQVAQGLGLAVAE